MCVSSTAGQGVLGVRPSRPDNCSRAVLVSSSCCAYVVQYCILLSGSSRQALLSHAASTQQLSHVPLTPTSKTFVFSWRELWRLSFVGKALAPLPAFLLGSLTGPRAHHCSSCFRTSGLDSPPVGLGTCRRPRVEASASSPVSLQI